MHPKTLYVIGNGFDLWHGIPSSFRDFKAYVLDKDHSVHREVEDYLPAGEDWCDLERALAQLDPDMLVDNLAHFLGSYGDENWSESGHHDFQYEVEKVVERLSTGLRARFAEWIRTLPIPREVTEVRSVIALEPHALFFTFNYTSTLSSFYKIDLKQVLHIHGRADKSDEELVLGHAWNPQIRNSLNTDLVGEDIDIRLIEANDFIDTYFSSTFKRSDELILQNSAFFESLVAIEQVVVLGHSLSEIDWIYFRTMLQQPTVAAARWVIACRSEKEWTEKAVRLIKMGLLPGRATPVDWKALQSAK